jgi:hypothetical protein
VNVSTGIADDEVGTHSYTNGLKLFVMSIPSCITLLTNPLLFCLDSNNKAWFSRDKTRGGATRYFRVCGRVPFPGFEMQWLYMAFITDSKNSSLLLPRTSLPIIKSKIGYAERKRELPYWS